MTGDEWVTFRSDGRKRAYWGRHDMPVVVLSLAKGHARVRFGNGSVEKVHPEDVHATPTK